MKALALICCAIGAIPQSDSEIRALIEKLGNERLEVREEATRKLRELGDRAKPALEAAAKGGDAERATRARGLLRFFEVRAKLSPGLLKAIPGAAERLAVSDRAWAEVLLEATAFKDSEPQFPFITRNDLEFLTAPAVDAALDTQQRVEVLRRISEWHLKSGRPAVERLLHDPNETVRTGALTCLRFFGPEMTPKIAEALKDDSIIVRKTALGLLGERKEWRFVPEFRDILEKGPQELRGLALYWLIQLEGAAGAKEDVDRHLDSLSTETAVQILAALADPRLAPKAFTLANDKSYYVRKVAMGALVRMGARQYLDHMLHLLDDEDIKNRIIGAAAVARLGKPEHGSRLLFQLKHDDYSVRLGGVACFRVLDDPKYVEDILPLLHDPHVLVREHAAVTLNSLGFAKADPLIPLIDPKDARFVGRSAELAMSAADMAMRSARAEQDRIADLFRKLENDASIEVSTVASIALVRLGRKDRAAHRALVDRVDGSPMFGRYADSLCESLSIATEPRLREPIELKAAIETSEDINAAIKPLGLRAEFDLSVEERTRTGRTLAVFEILRRHSNLSMVVEKGVIRMHLRSWSALEKWSEILK